MKILPSLTTVCTLCSVLLLVAKPVEAQLRIVDYNTAGGPRAGLSTVLEAIGQEVVNGFAKSIGGCRLRSQGCQSAW